MITKLYRIICCVGMAAMAAIPVIALATVLLAAGLSADCAPASEQIVKGPFKPNFESLKQYKCPEWFRDAKFGIWAHWSAQCEPEDGDWYARGMYMQGDAQYNYHVAHYGHPSKFGYKDICNEWKAENWDPDKLIKLYKRAGAKYFVALANHHCNFDNWDSKYQPWNSVNVGPKKDVIGTWAKYARANGLHFGVTVHSARAWNWLEVSRDSDKEGPMQGVPYDGNLTKADGKGQWWEGLDPADLYCKPHTPGAPPDQEYITKWFNRTKDLIDKYNPDLLYFDEVVVPFGDTGMDIFTHFYNSNIMHHNGKLEAVLNTKIGNPDARKSCVWEIERGVAPEIEPCPWQGETCIGGWQYKRGYNYQKASAIIPLLVDIVSKNGNLLLSIPVKGDGTLDNDELKFIAEMTKWMDVNGEGIFATRPWKIFCDGPRVASNLLISQNPGTVPVRFTTKKNVLYAFMMDWPKDGKVTIKSLPASLQKNAKITGIKMLGHKSALPWKQDAHGLTVWMPSKKPCDYVYTLKIACNNLKKLEPASPDERIDIKTDSDTVLRAEQSQLHGTEIQYEVAGDVYYIGYWEHPEDWASWKIRTSSPQTFELSMECASGVQPDDFTLDLAGKQIAATAPKTPSWDDYTTISLGTVNIPSPGDYTLKIRPRNITTWKGLNIKSIIFKAVK